MSPIIKIKRSNTKKVRATFYQSDGETALDITNWTVRFVVRTEDAETSDTDDNTSNEDTLIVKENGVGDHTTPAAGITDFILTSDDTDIDPGEYFYASEARDTGTPANKAEGPTGVFEVIADIVRG